MGINLDSYVSLAAGFDKNCSMLGALDKLGFGYIVGGTITLHPRPGNLKPRIKRYVSDKSMINALGFPNDGLKKNDLGREKYIENILLIGEGTTASKFVDRLERFKTLGIVLRGVVETESKIKSNISANIPRLGNIFQLLKISDHVRSAFVCFFLLFVFHSHFNASTLYE